MHSVRAVAEYLLSKVNVEIGESISNLQLQKLVYYAQGWHLAFYGTPLFVEEIQAWRYGPVVKPLYDELERFGAMGIPCPDELSAEARELAPEERALLDAVWQSYAHIYPPHLIDRTHLEDPWIEARAGLPADARSTAPISHESLARYFRERAEELHSEAVVRAAMARPDEAIPYEEIAADLGLPVE